ncbi:MAG: hypothetical protein VX899_08610 [Myxococcota bacterium]|nr:hypothetical protein [Myxococcota bacterium]
MLLLLLACTPETGVPGLMGSAPLGEGTLAPDFELPDVNPASASFEEQVSVSQHLERGSVWYFGHST